MMTFGSIGKYNHFISTGIILSQNEIAGSTPTDDFFFFLTQKNGFLFNYNSAAQNSVVLFVCGCINVTCIEEGEKLKVILLL